MSKGMVHTHYCVPCRQDATTPTFERRDREEVERHVKKHHPDAKVLTSIGERSVTAAEYLSDPDYVTHPKEGTVHLVTACERAAGALEVRTKCGVVLNVVEGLTGDLPVENNGDRCGTCPWDDT